MCVSEEVGCVGRLGAEEDSEGMCQPASGSPEGQTGVKLTGSRALRAALRPFHPALPPAGFATTYVCVTVCVTLCAGGE